MQPLLLLRSTWATKVNSTTTMPGGKSRKPTRIFSYQQTWFSWKIFTDSGLDMKRWSNFIKITRWVIFCVILSFILTNTSFVFYRTPSWKMVSRSIKRRSWTTGSNAGLQTTNCCHHRIKFNKTELRLRSNKDSSSSCERTHTNPKLNRSGSRHTQSSGLITGGITVNGVAELLLPLIIFRSNSKKEENLTIQDGPVASFGKISGKRDPCPRDSGADGSSGS